MNHEDEVDWQEILYWKNYCGECDSSPCCCEQKPVSLEEIIELMEEEDDTTADSDFPL